MNFWGFCLGTQVGKKSVAGTSSFGMSGVNAHALVGSPEVVHTYTPTSTVSTTASAM